MKLSLPIQYSVQYKIMRDAQEECAHWDDEIPNGMGLPCCNKMLDAQERVMDLKRKLRTK